jgi:hypothetical protein
MNFMDGVLKDRARDCVIRNCLAGHGTTDQLRRALVNGGHYPPGAVEPVHRFLNSMIEAKEIVRVRTGFYVATCEHCHTPILNVLGAEH